jgi:hypothetical protein
MRTKPAQYRLRHSGYVSEYEQFLDTFMAGHPEVAQDQRRGWYIWWDRQVDLNALVKEHDDTIPAKSYPYD